MRSVGCGGGGLGAHLHEVEEAILGRLAHLDAQVLLDLQSRFAVRVQGSGFRVQGSGFMVQSSGFRVQG